VGQLELPPSTPRVLTVGELVRGAHRVLEQRFGLVWVEGEVTGLKLAQQGHAYFSLVGDGAVLPVAMWKTALTRLRFRLEEGQTLRVCGRLGIYDRQGRFQLYAERAEPAGLGALLLQLRQLRERLEAEGLLNPARKRRLPAMPRIVGVVTSARGAAIHDVVEVARRRCPTRILLVPAQVQGPGAARSLREGLERLSGVEGVDVIILGRGGGSAEDLWAFNDEALVRAVAACPVPVVAAIGHEVDSTACDWVADVRAATPSHAAELVVPDLEARRSRLETAGRQLRRSVERRLLDERRTLAEANLRLTRRARRLLAVPRAELLALRARLERAHPRARLMRHRGDLGHAQARLAALGRALVARSRARWCGLTGALHALSPLAVLDRGYGVITDERGTVVTSAASVGAGAALTVRLADGRLRTRVEAVEAERPGASRTVPRGATPQS
jgi:exodeoxyribonuclease VII large subunit